MEKRLINIIAIPAMILTIILGLILLYYQINLISENYFIIKFIFVILLIIYQIYLVCLHKIFREKNNKRTDKFYKIINEIPTLFMIIIILLVVLKPNLG